MTKNQKNNKSNEDGDGDNKSVMSSDPTMYVEWSEENENILAEWCDVAQCYKWLNLRSHQKLSRLHAWFTIPAITLSTITGTASFAQTSLPENMRSFAPMVIGTINILIGILTTVQQYLKVSELNEAHRVAAISWDKFARNIRIELSKKLDERTDAGHFLKMCRQEYDRLMETSPTIPDSIVNEFTKTFKGVENSEQREKFEKLKKPDICDTIVSIDDKRKNWYELKEQSLSHTANITKELKMMAEKHKDEFIVQQQEELNTMKSQLEEKIQKEHELIVARRRKSLETDKLLHEQEEERQKQLKEEIKQQDEIKAYISDFEGVYERKPEGWEIAQHVKNNMPHIQESVVDNFLLEYNV